MLKHFFQKYSSNFLQAIQFSRQAFHQSPFTRSGETILSFKKVSFEYSPTKPVLLDSSFNIKEGSKVTIMGQNGAGKSTILKLMNNSLKPTSGSINVKAGYALSTAMQVIPIEDREKTVLEFFLHHCHGTRSGLDSRIAEMLQQVNLSEAKHDRLIKSFSGGQQARLLLASALILKPDILLLDEPTNNLDVAGIDMLRTLLLTSAQTCVVISHDEDFLNSFTDSVLYLDNHFKKVEYYDGNYDVVKREITNRINRENAENARLAREALQKKQQASAFANKGGGMRKVAKKLKEEAESLESDKIIVRKEDKALKDFNFPFQSADNTGQSVPVRLMTISSLTLPGGKTLDFAAQPVLLERGSHVRISGPNGIGKTTFLEAIVNGEAEGVVVHKNASIGYYRQDFHNLDHDDTVIQILRKASDNKHTEQHIRAVAAQFLLRGEIVKQKVFTLSEGQKGLVALASIVLKEPAILILDEPTNHINFRHLPAIAAAINSFEGAVLVVSHDSDFMQGVKVTKQINLRDEIAQDM